jgi:hypothetical protein
MFVYQKQMDSSYQQNADTQIFLTNFKVQIYWNRGIKELLDNWG